MDVLLKLELAIPTIVRVRCSSQSYIFIIILDIFKAIYNVIIIMRIIQETVNGHLILNGVSALNLVTEDPKTVPEDYNKLLLMEVFPVQVNQLSSEIATCMDVQVITKFKMMIKRQLQY